MHVLYAKIRNNSVNFCIKVTVRMSSRTCYTKLNLEFPYVRSLSLCRDTNINIEGCQLHDKVLNLASDLK